MLLPPCLIECIIGIIKKDYIIKEKVKIKQVLKNDEYQKNIISKVFKKINKNDCLYQSQEQTQAINIQDKQVRISIN